MLVVQADVTFSCDLTRWKWYFWIWLKSVQKFCNKSHWNGLTDSRQLGNKFSSDIYVHPFDLYVPLVDQKATTTTTDPR